MTERTYRKRAEENVKASDGSPVFARPEDQQREELVKRLVEEKWNCELMHLGALSPIDYWATRHGRPVAWIEVKGRQHKGPDRYPAEALNVRKWATLTMMSVMTPWPAVFISVAEDLETGRVVIRYIDVGHIDAHGSGRWGVFKPREGNIKSSNDTEPFVRIDHDQMAVLYDSDQQKGDSTNGRRLDQDA